MMTLDRLIEEALTPLVGKSLHSLPVRSGDMLMLQFGAPTLVTDMRGLERVVGEYALHLECPWRIVDDKGVVVGFEDMFCPANRDIEPEEFDRERHTSLADDKLTVLFGDCEIAPIPVESVRTEYLGNFRLSFSGGKSLEVFIANSVEGDHWRIFRHGGHDFHFVVSNDEHGILCGEYIRGLE